MLVDYEPSPADSFRRSGVSVALFAGAVALSFVAR
jgi:hypothetical protein